MQMLLTSLMHYLFFKGTTEHTGRKLSLNTWKCLKKSVFLHKWQLQSCYKARGCLQRWLLCAISVYKVTPQCSKTSVWTKWKEKRGKKKFVLCLFLRRIAGRVRMNIFSHRNDTKHKATAREGEAAPAHRPACASQFIKHLLIFWWIFFGFWNYDSQPYAQRFLLKMQNLKSGSLKSS